MRALVLLALILLAGCATRLGDDNPHYWGGISHFYHVHH
jgi:hypothetical protein